MSVFLRKLRFTQAAVAGVIAVISGMALAAGTKVTLSGDQEVPPVNTSATGHGTITVGDDKICERQRNDFWCRRHGGAYP